MTTPQARRRVLGEVLGLTGIACVLVFLLGLAGRFVPAVASYVPAAIAVVFLYLPAMLAWRRGQGLSDWGLSMGPVPRRTIAFGLGVPLAIFPLFLAAFVAFNLLACGPLSGLHLAPPGMCRHFVGWAGLAHPAAPADFLQTALAQLVVVAVPEEIFFRGWILARLEEVFPPRRRLLGGGVGWALVISSALFAVAHVIITPDPRRLAVFFPGLLFGWMRSATGSVAAGAFVHAASNLYIAVLQRTFFPL